MVTGTENTGDMALDCLVYVLDHSSAGNCLFISNFLMGCFVRVLTYRISPPLKLRLSDLIIRLVHKAEDLEKSDREAHVQAGLNADVFKLMSNQISSLAITMLTDLERKKNNIRDKGEDENDMMPKYEALNNSILVLADLINEKNGNSFLVKKWAKRCIVDKRCAVDGLKAYLEWDPKYATLKDSVLSKVLNRVLEGIDDL